MSFGVRIQGVEKFYGAYHALRNVDLSIDQGEFAVLLGPSGCGKSTLLRVIAGLEDAAKGAVLIGDRDVTWDDPGKRNIAMVFQNYALYPHMNVAENMGFALRLAKVEESERISRVKEAADMLGLADLLDRFPKQLSGGQRQRVAMGRALVRKTGVFLFDEPLSNLDAKLRMQMRVEIRSLHQRLGVTSIYVTHDQVEAMTLADRIIVMREGAIEQMGAPLEIFDRPANLFVAGFLGSPQMNLLDAVISDGNAVLASGITVLLPSRIKQLVEEEMPVVIGIRPQDLKAEEAGLLRCEVEVVENTGTETLVHGHHAGVTLAVVSSNRLAIAPGRPLFLTPRTDRLHVFSKHTGNAL